MAVTGALLGVLLLHLRYAVIKLPPAGFFVLKGEKKNPTKITGCFWKSPSVSSGPIPGAKSPSVPQLLFSFYVLTWPTEVCLVLHCILSTADGTAVLHWSVCWGTLNRVVLLTPAFVAPEHMFLLEPWSTSCGISNSNEQQTLTSC